MSLLLEYLQGMRNHYLGQFYMGAESSFGCEAGDGDPETLNFILSPFLQGYMEEFSSPVYTAPLVFEDTSFDLLWS